MRITIAEALNILDRNLAEAAGFPQWVAENFTDLLLNSRESDRWSVLDILEHVTLTNKFLLLSIFSNAGTCLKRSIDPGKYPVSEYTDLAIVDRIGELGAFVWQNPESQEPTGQKSFGDIQRTLELQWEDARSLLPCLIRGRGTLKTQRMTVDDLGHLDVYQWIYFMGKHAERHWTKIITHLKSGLY